MINRFANDPINNFTDSIFAIAITLLILEIKIPPTEDIETLGTLGVLGRLIPSFIGFLVSFFVTALYWRAHLMNAQFIKSYDGRMLWLTIWLLLFVVLLPFSTALYAKNFNYNGPFIFYCLNLVMIGVFNYLLVRYIIMKHGYNETLTPLLASWLKFRAVIAPLIWLFSALLALVMPLTARFVFVVIFVILMISDRRYKAKAKKLALATSAEPTTDSAAG